MRKRLAEIMMMASMMQMGVMDDKKLITAMPRYDDPLFFTNSGRPRYQAKHGKYKGWMRENKRCTFNKNK